MHSNAIIRRPSSACVRGLGNRTPRGFALVVALSLMILLTVIAVGLLTLSGVSLRQASQSSDMTLARSNARMALQLAIGDLQKALGPDRRISARASLVHGPKVESNVVGAWESWRWDPADTKAPDYNAKKDRFAGWLTSTPTPLKATQLDTPLNAPESPVWLMRAKQGASATTDPDEPPAQLRASMVTVRNLNRPVTGGMAYAVMDESLKASINLPAPPQSPDIGQAVASRIAPYRTKPEVLIPGLAPTANLQPERLLSLDTAALAVGDTNAAVLTRQDALTTHSLGLLTDEVKGGFKLDLTTAFESTDPVADFFGSTLAYGSATDGGASWDYFRNHYQLYRRTTGGATGSPKFTWMTRDMKPARSGFDRSPVAERLLPVISKLQVMFSIVTHPSHIADRINFFNTRAVPPGNNNYGCPHLVYDPVVTLYNPYDVAIEIPKLRLRIWDPPVVFGFKKNNAWLRDEFAAANGRGFQGLARFQIANEGNPNARRSFTLLLTEKTSTNSTGVPGRSIRMNPGEVKVFSPWVESTWTWGLETAGGYTVRAFFDWNAGNDFGNVDGRTTVQSNLKSLGIQAVPGWDPRAGLQTDHLSYAARPAATRYDFELANNWNGGWLGIKATDTFSAYAKPGRTVADASQPDFTVDLLAGQNQTPETDYLRSYVFRFEDVEGEIAGKSPAPIIERRFLVSDLMQLAGDRSPGGKSPFALLTMSAKTTADPKDVSKPWLFNHPVVEGADMNSRSIGSALDSYDLRFEEVGDFNVFPGIEVDGQYGFYGASSTADKGVSNVPMFRVPLVPATSLGDLIPANLAASSSLPRVTRPFGASNAHPLLPGDKVIVKSPASGGGNLHDHSYLLNDLLWDSTFFSTAASFTGGLAKPTNRKSLLQEFLDGAGGLPNPRFVPWTTAGTPAASQAGELDSLPAKQFARRIAASIAVAGAFNINSDSTSAWRTLLSSLRDEAVRGWMGANHDSKNKTSFPRAGLPLGGDAEGNSTASIDVKGRIRWAGFRSLTDLQIEQLAKAIVAEIRRRGSEDDAPSLSLAEFVNRRVGPATATHVLAGLLEEAIRKSGINRKFLDDPSDSRPITGSEPLHAAALKGVELNEARLGHTAEGAPPVITQGDLLMPLSSVITARGDTFRIRAYGEARDAAGKATAKAWCEAVVQRGPEYLDPADEASDGPAELSRATNTRFGRRFIITSFRWLNASEI